MGFSIVCAGVHVPKLLIQALTILGFIQRSILTILSFLGLSEPETVWTGRPGFPAPSYPTRALYVPVSTIREMLPVVKYSEIVAGARSGEETPDSCAVCLHDFEPEEEIRRLTNCRHVFHRGCVDRWMDHDQTTCPLCRAPFVTLPEIQDQGSVDFLGDYLPFSAFI